MSQHNPTESGKNTSKWWKGVEGGQTISSRDGFSFGRLMIVRVVHKLDFCRIIAVDAHTGHWIGLELVWRGGRWCRRGSVQRRLRRGINVHEAVVVHVVVRGIVIL
jgi:hypothetical protein